MDRWLKSSFRPTVTTLPSLPASHHAALPTHLVSHASYEAATPLIAVCVGTGGIWFWIEIDTGGSGDISGAGCGHVIGGGGPHSAGARSLRGEVTWSYSSFEQAPGGVNSFGFFDPNDQYYLVTTPDGEQWLFPVTTGHHSFSPVHGVTLQLQIAP